MTQVSTTPELIQAVTSLLVTDLTSSRLASQQMIADIIDRYECTEETLLQFFDQRAAQLEEYEQDILFSLQLTPTTANRQPYMALLKATSLTQQQVDGLVDELTAQQLKMPIEVKQGQVAQLPLTETMLTRYIQRLGLQKAVDGNFVARLEEMGPSDLQPFLLDIARDEVLQKPFAQEAVLALIQALTNPSGTREELETLVSMLVDFLRTYRAENWTTLRDQLRNYRESCQQDQAGAAEHMFHHTQLRAEHEDSDLVASKVNNVQQHYAELIQQAERLSELLPLG